MRGEWEERDREMVLELLKRGARSCRVGPTDVWATGFYLERAFWTCPRSSRSSNETATRAFSLSRCSADL